MHRIALHSKSSHFLYNINQVYIPSLEVQRLIQRLTPNLKSISDNTVVLREDTFSEMLLARFKP